MPSYDFKCCDLIETITAGIKETIQSPTCSKCGESMKRDYGNPTITFNGKGFYTTDKNA